jgi:hypothetical protein
VEIFFGDVIDEIVCYVMGSKNEVLCAAAGRLAAISGDNNFTDALSGDNNFTDAPQRR